MIIHTEVPSYEFPKTAYIIGTYKRFLARFTFMTVKPFMSISELGETKFDNTYSSTFVPTAYIIGIEL